MLLATDKIKIIIIRFTAVFNKVYRIIVLTIRCCISLTTYLRSSLNSCSDCVVIFKHVSSYLNVNDGFALPYTFVLSSAVTVSFAFFYCNLIFYTVYVKIQKLLPFSVYRLLFRLIDYMSYR